MIYLAVDAAGPLPSATVVILLTTPLVCLPLSIYRAGHLWISQGPTLGLIFCCHSPEILSNARSGGLTLSFHTEFYQSWSRSWSRLLCEPLPPPCPMHQRLDSSSMRPSGSVVDVSILPLCVPSHGLHAPCLELRVCTSISFQTVSSQGKGRCPPRVLYSSPSIS